MPQGLRSSARGKQPPTAEDVRTAIMGLTHDFGRLADAQKTDGGWTESSRIFHEMLGGRKGVSRQSIGNMTFHSDEQFTARKGELVFLKGDSSKDIRAQIHERLGPTHESVSNISLPLPVAQFDKHPELLKKRIWVRVSDESSSDITTWSFAPQHVVVFVGVEGDASLNFGYRQHDLDSRSMSKWRVFCSWLSSCQETYRAAEMVTLQADELPDHMRRVAHLERSGSAPRWLRSRPTSSPTTCAVSPTLSVVARRWKNVDPEPSQVAERDRSG
jgi:hypothetical protein